MMRTATAVAVCLLAAACGGNTEQRSATGGLTGLGVGALVGGPVGAVVGGAVGAAGGAATPVGADTLAKKGVEKGKELYTSATGEPAVGRSHVSRDTVMQVQNELQGQGLYDGPIDGIAGPKTREGLRQFQARQGMPQTGEIDTATLQQLNGGAPAVATGPTGNGQLMTTEQVRQRLARDGYRDIGDVTPSGSNAYTVHAKRGNVAYVMDIDGRTGRILSRQAATAQPSVGTSQPSNQ
jgi:peptidoglycan hydrolase-like protein with peptidoglycan-binding domain